MGALRLIFAFFSLFKKQLGANLRLRPRTYAWYIKERSLYITGVPCIEDNDLNFSVLSMLSCSFKIFIIRGFT